MVLKELMTGGEKHEPDGYGKNSGNVVSFSEPPSKAALVFQKAAETGAFGPGTVLELTVKTPDGREMAANMKIMAEDLELLEQIAAMKK